MMSLKRPGTQTNPDQASPDQAFTAQVPRIGAADLAMVQAAMAECAPEWSVELQGTCADEATLVVLPEDGEDAVGPSFLVSRETYGLRLDQLHWDVVTEVGVYASMTDVVDVLRLRLAFRGSSIGPACVTLH
jgi:hypothetical protein